MTIQDQHGETLRQPTFVPDTVNSFGIASAETIEDHGVINTAPSIPVATKIHDWNGKNDLNVYQRYFSSAAEAANNNSSSGANYFVTGTGGSAAAAVPSSNPPRNCPDGGQWGTVNYNGSKTGALACIGVMICGIPGLFILGCPQDTKDAYLYKDKVYDAGGKLMGPRSCIRFIPSRQNHPHLGCNCH